MKKLKGKTAIITGSTSGIGLIISKLLLEEDVKTYLVGRDFAKLKSEISKNNLTKKDAHFVYTDLVNGKNLENIVRETKNETRIDIVIHCAGVISLDLMENENIANLDNQYLVNVRAPYLLTQTLLPQIKKAKGDIIFINSTAGLDSWEKVGQYSASKHALKAIADSLRKELIKNRVRVTSFFLGSIDTPMQKRVQHLEGKQNYNPKKYMSPNLIAELVLYIIKMPKQASVTDITIRQNI